MRKREVIRTTLGELIVAVTDEVMPFIRDPLGRNMAVACIVTDVLAHNHVRDHISSRRKNTRRNPIHYSANVRRSRCLAG